ncbi:hypothetical protein IFM89_037837 [Coptis chinensis]|uniref:Uncharacterized protein n=1 Tax=Coptis chinensis TaxID=261450 RepID=A0A835HQ61_9MAGN|nr:hypothetical protein IFM89_037837 [Coptis chinensis]
MMISIINNKNNTDNQNKDDNAMALLAKTHRPRRRSHTTGTAVVVVLSLLFSTTAWLSLVFSGTTTRCWHRLKDSRPSTPLPPPPPPQLLMLTQKQKQEALSLDQIVFGIAGSSQLWKRRKEYVRLWWRPRRHAWPPLARRAT